MYSHFANPNFSSWLKETGQKFKKKKNFKRSSLLRTMSGDFFSCFSTVSTYISNENLYIFNMKIMSSKSLVRRVKKEATHIFKINLLVFYLIKYIFSFSTKNYYFKPFRNIFWPELYMPKVWSQEQWSQSKPRHLQTALVNTVFHFVFPTHMHL